jgi:hypothetical protein
MRRQLDLMMNGGTGVTQSEWSNGWQESAVRVAETRRRVTNVYFSPLATKPQAVGFGLHYLKRMRGTATSIIYPLRPSYDKETSTGVGRSWIYPIHL